MDIETIKEWQTLVGSFLGAALPLVVLGVVYVVRNWWTRRQERLIAVRTLTQEILHAETTILDLRMEIDLFIKRLDQILSKSWPNTHHILAITNFPNVGPIPWDRSILGIVRVLRSAYLNTRVQYDYAKIVELYGFLQNMIKNYDRALETHQAFVVTAHISKLDANMIYRDELTAIRRVLNQYFLSSNIPTLMKILIRTQVGLKRYSKHPYYWRWQLEKALFWFSPLFTPEKHLGHQNKYMDRIDAKIEKETEKHWNELEAIYKEDLHRQLEIQSL